MGTEPAMVLGDLTREVLGASRSNNFLVALVMDGMGS
jgi:hypothetical protein